MVIGFLKPKKPKWNILISDLDAPTTRAGAYIYMLLCVQCNALLKYNNLLYNDVQSLIMEDIITYANHLSPQDGADAPL